MGSYQDYEEVTDLEDQGQSLKDLKAARDKAYDEYINACERFEESCIPSAELVSAYTTFDKADETYREAAGDVWYDPVMK